ncbi:MAG: YcfL family protein [Verrucomicrobia bacterium]|nr:YcfL family protein [Verrucomicrobiota bacterium]
MKKLLLPLAVLALLAAGCSTPPEGAYAPVNTTTHDLENKLKFVLMDPGAQRSVTASGIQERINPDGRLEVAVNLRNRENRRLQVQANCVFKDDQGFAVDETPFQNVILTENAQETVRWVSLTPAARKYTIRVREAR